MKQEDFYKGVPRAPGYELSYKDWEATDALRRELYNLVRPVGENVDMLFGVFDTFLRQPHVQKLTIAQQYLLTIQFIAHIIQMVMLTATHHLTHKLAPGIAAVYLPMMFQRMMQDCNKHLDVCVRSPILLHGTLGVQFDDTPEGREAASHAASSYDMGEVLLKYVTHDLQQQEEDRKLAAGAGKEAVEALHKIAKETNGGSTH